MKFLILQIQAVRTVHAEEDDALASAAYDAIIGAARRFQAAGSDFGQEFVEVALSTGPLAVHPGAVVDIQLITADETFLQQRAAHYAFEQRIKRCAERAVAADKAAEAA